MKRRSLLGMIPVLLLAPAGICLRSNPDFSGTWIQNNDRCIPKRTGKVTLRIDHHDPELMIETTIVRDSTAPRHAVQRYTTDGNGSISTGADSDEFHTSIVWNGKSLVFSVEEHEDGRILLSKETWTLAENGGAIERIREGVQPSSDASRKQTLIYSRDLAKS